MRLAKPCCEVGALEAPCLPVTSTARLFRAVNEKNSYYELRCGLSRRHQLITLKNYDSYPKVRMGRESNPRPRISATTVRPQPR